ncbi:MAG: hypothetical protein ABSG63_07250, partial [Spirochaetia bacterium]
QVPLKFTHSGSGNYFKEPITERLKYYLGYALLMNEKPQPHPVYLFILCQNPNSHRPFGKISKLTIDYSEWDAEGNSVSIKRFKNSLSFSWIHYNEKYDDWMCNKRFHVYCDPYRALIYSSEPIQL